MSTDIFGKALKDKFIPQWKGGGQHEQNKNHGGIGGKMEQNYRRGGR